jgi:hypothetical protein
MDLMHSLFMRTSVTLDDDIYELATHYAKGRGITLGAALGELVRRGERATQANGHSPELVREANGLLVFAATPGRVITSELVKKYQEDEIE